ncbi:hypothetical protein F511_09800 [Dorcoceras hygrometricum]|uniref:Uncharacterized protein n=1 Tax=Dorcoceras hygrometricum TaxID=472368 RepID=A0A2Z7C0K7_9LAMI|nr:hypothetical protein F511_09800 [Dorcoceras hygrometricum]
MLAMENTRMACMFKSLVDTGLEGFLAASGSVYEDAVVDFLANAKAVEKKKKKKKQEKVKKVVEKQTVEAGSQAAPTKSKSGTSSEEDSCTPANLKKGGMKRKQVVESSNSEATVTVPSVLITKKNQTKQANKGSTAGGPEDTVATPAKLEKQNGDGSNTPAQDEHMQFRNETSNVSEQEERLEDENKTEKEGQDGNVSTTAQGEREKSTTDDGTGAGNREESTETWHEPAQPAQKPTTYTGEDVYAAIEIQNSQGKDINNQDIMAIRFLEAELTKTRKNINLFQARAGLPVTYNERSADRVGSLDFNPCLTWEEFKAQLAKHTNTRPDKQTDQEHEPQIPEPTADGQIEEIDRIFEHHTTQLRQQLQNAVDGLEIRIDVLESNLGRKFADSHQEIAALENGLIRHFADSQQHIVDEVASLKSQVAKMVDCLRELRDAKKGEGPSKNGEGPSSRKGEGTSSSKKRKWF